MAEIKQRRSARISAPDTWKDSEVTRVGRNTKTSETRQATVTGPGLPGRKRGRKKRKKLRAVQDVVVNSVKKSIIDETVGNEKYGDENNREDICKAPPSDSWMPEKRLLEIILDILQKKDVHEIFAEPVDAEEVEGYYDIIKHPMDFGTMRAKLQEGLYSTLKQFEDDIFLISSNAMLFNSSSTIFFRHARSIQELAKKTFHALKTDPANFESEYVVTRRRSTNLNKKINRSQGETSIKQKAVTFDIQSNVSSVSSRGLNAKRTFQTSTLFESSPIAENRKENGVHSGKDGRYTLFEEERRSTYRSWDSFLSENELIPSTLQNNSKQLTYINHGLNGYMDSLLKFVEGLGSTAQMVARRKLQQCTIPTNTEMIATPPTSFILSSPSNVVSNIPNFTSHPIVKVTDEERIDPSCLIGGKREWIYQNQLSASPSVPVLSTSHTQDSRFSIPSTSNHLNRQSLTVPDSGLRNRIHSNDILQDLSQSKLLEFIMTRNGNNWFSHQNVLASCSGQQASPILLSREKQDTIAPETTHSAADFKKGLDCKTSRSDLKGKEAIFDISYLQSRLGEMNSRDQNGYTKSEMRTQVQESSLVKPSVGVCEGPVNQPNPNSHDFLDKQNPDLALQL